MKRVKETEYPTVGSREPRRFRTSVSVVARPLRRTACAHVGIIGWYYPRSCARSFSGHAVGTSLKIIIARCSMQSRLGAKLESGGYPAPLFDGFGLIQAGKPLWVWFGATAERPLTPHVKFGKVRRTGTCREKQGVHYRACDCAHRRPIFGAGPIFSKKTFCKPPGGFE